MPPLPLRAIFKEQNKKECYMGDRTEENYVIPEFTENEWDALLMLHLLGDMSEDTWLKAKIMMEALALKQSESMQKFTEVLFRISERERKGTGNE